jgi:hypothetical protein
MVSSSGGGGLCYVQERTITCKMPSRLTSQQALSAFVGNIGLSQTYLVCQRKSTTQTPNNCEDGHVACMCSAHSEASWVHAVCQRCLFIACALCTVRGTSLGTLTLSVSCTCTLSRGNRSKGRQVVNRRKCNFNPSQTAPSLFSPA